MPDQDSIVLVLTANAGLAVSVMAVDWKWRQRDDTQFFDPKGRAAVIVTRSYRLHGCSYGTLVYLIPGWWDNYQMPWLLRKYVDIGRLVVFDQATGNDRGALGTFE